MPEQPISDLVIRSRSRIICLLEKRHLLAREKAVQIWFYCELSSCSDSSQVSIRPNTKEYKTQNKRSQVLSFAKEKNMKKILFAFQNTRVHPKSKQPSFEVCIAWLFLRNEVDFVNVRFDSGNLDCQPLNPWTSMAGRDAPGENFLPSASINSLAQPYSGLSCRNSATLNSEKPFRESFASSCEG